MTTTVHAVLPPPDDGGRWERLAAAHATAGPGPHSGGVVLEAEEYFETVGWPDANGARMVPVQVAEPSRDPEAAAESYTLAVSDIPAGATAIVFTNSY